MYGSHVKFERSLTETAKHAVYEGMTSMQVFLGSPYSFQRRSLDKADVVVEAKVFAATSTESLACLQAAVGCQVELSKLIDERLDGLMEQWVPLTLMCALCLLQE